ncbi:putative reverse transcriptase domain-containing protein, partial [Tanacetum coccineum]
STGNTNVANTQKSNGAAPKGNGCFECGARGHFKRDCPKLKNKDGGNRNAQGWVYTAGNAEKRGNASGNPYFNVITGTFLLNNHYASILFDTGADRRFISSAFSSLIDITHTPLENSYDVELVDGKIVRVDTIMRGCTLNFLNHPFNIDLMPVKLGSFDVIIGMDWLRRCHAVIVCDEKLVRIPYGNETLVFLGNKSNDGRESRLTIISCSKAQEYMAKGCQIFLAHISAKKEEDKSEGKQLKDIDLIPGVAPVARAPYRLAPSEMKELSEQLQELSDKGFIRPSSSPWGAPVLFVKKKDGSFRMCIDYRELNKLTVKNRYSLPRIDDLFDQLQGYAIRTNKRTCGIHGPLMKPSMKTYLDKFVIVFIDAILIYSKDKKEHEEHLKAILELIKEGEVVCQVFKMRDEFWIRWKENVMVDALSRKERIEPLRQVLVIVRGQGQNKGHRNVKYHSTQYHEWENDPLDKLAKAVYTEQRLLALNNGYYSFNFLCDRDGRFTSNFWRSFQKALGTDNIQTKDHLIKPDDCMLAPDRPKVYADLEAKANVFDRWG